MEETPTNQDDDDRLSERLPTSSATTDARMFQEDRVATPHMAAYRVSSTRRASTYVGLQFQSEFKL